MTNNFEKEKLYSFGPYAGEFAKLNTTDNPVFERRGNFPRVYPGSHFINNLGARSIEDYLKKNPENFDTKKNYHFYEVLEGGKLHYLRPGNFISIPYPQPVLRQSSSRGGGLGDGVGPTQRFQNGDDSHGMSRTRASELEAENARIRSELLAKISEIDNLRNQVSSANNAKLEAERLMIQAQANLQLEKDRHEDTKVNLKKEFDDALATQKTIQEKDAEIMKYESAKAAQEALSDDEEEDTVLSGLMEQAVPVLVPVAQSLLELGFEWLKDRANSKKAAQSPQIPSEAQPQPQTQPINTGRFDYVTPQPQPQPQPQ